MTTPSVPRQMKAAAIDRFGGPEVLHVETLPVPQPGEHDVLLRVKAAGIGVWDPFMREGGFDDGSTRFPHVLGADGAGEVVAVGPGVRRLRVGDHAYAFQMTEGFYAEYACVEESRAAPIPAGMDETEAGALGADGVTALCGLEDQLHLQRGQSLMIVGASGGIGHMAVQLAKRMGARVLAVASEKDGVALAKKLGADVVIDGKRDDIAKAARAFAPAGLDAALVLAGGDAVNAGLETVRRGGKIAVPHGVEPVPRAPQGVQLLAYDGVQGADALDRLNRLIGNTPIHVEISKTYELDEVAQAHRDVERHHLGKLAVRIS